MAGKELTKAEILKRVELAKEDLNKIPGLRTHFSGFLNFVREQGVVGLAVGLVLGSAAKSVVDSMVINVFNPMIGLFGADGGSLETRYACLKTVGSVCTNKLGYGHLLSMIISFVIVAGVVYLIVKGLKLDKLDKKKS